MKIKIKLQIVIPIIIAVIILGLAVYFDYRNKNKEPEPPILPDVELEYPKPVPMSENPRREEELQMDQYWGCASPENIKPITLKEPDKKWLINKNEETTFVSLGQYRIVSLAKTVLDIPKIWLYFFSEELSDREDNLYGLEKSYISGISLIVNGQERKLNLGGDEYMFIELNNYPFGDIYPYDKNVGLDFEFLIEIKCKNIKDEECLDNKGELLKYINRADIESRIRIFAIGCQEFTHDMRIESKFKYGE